MLKFWLGMITGVFVFLILFAITMLVSIKIGFFPMAAAHTKPFPLERFFARIALDTAIGNVDDVTSPVIDNEAALVSGAGIYKNQCSFCHGLPDREPPHIAKSMFPHAPFLMPPKTGVTDDKVGETYWKVKYGVRFTGMPGFRDSLSEKEIWQVSYFLLHADKIPPAALEELKPRAK